MSERGRRGRPAELLASAALVVACLLGLCPGVLAGRTLFLRDLSVFHRPLRRVLQQLQTLAQGPPLWNPFAHCGQPFAANPNAGVADPWTVLYWLLPFDAAFNLEVLLPLLVGAAGFAWLVRTRGGSRAAAVFGSLSWGLGGCALSVSGYLQMHHAVALLPAVLAATMRLVRGDRREALPLLAILLGLQGLAGSPTALLLTALLLPAAAWDEARRRPSRRSFGPMAAALVLGATIGAASWWPAALHLPQTARTGSEVFVERAAEWSLPPARLLELGAPRLLGHVEPSAVGWYWGREFYGWRQWPYLFSLYAGLAALVFAATALSLRRREDAPWILAGLLGLLLSFGGLLPGWAFIVKAVPPLAVLRFPEKWAVAPSLVLVLLAARGFDLVRSDERAAARARAAAASLAGLLTLVAAAACVADAGTWAGRFGVPDWLAPEAAAAAATDFLAQALLALGLAGLLFSKRRLARAWTVSILAFTALDLVLAGRCLLPTAEPEHFDRPPQALQALAAERPAGYLFQYADWKKHEVRRAGRELVVEPPAPWQWGLATALEKDFDGTQYLWSRRSTEELLPLMAERPDLVAPILARRSVVAVLRPPEPGEAEPLTLLATRDAAPLAFVADRLLVRDAGESLADALRRLGPSAARTVVFEAGAELPVELGTARLGPLERRPGLWRVEVDVPGPQPALLALNTSWHPDVRVRLAPSGELLPAWRVDGHLCAVIVPEGRHELELAHVQRAALQGRRLSMAGLVGALLLLLLGRPRRGPADMAS